MFNRLAPIAVAAGLAVAAFAVSGRASANTTKLDYVWGGDTTKPATVFVHGHGNCVGTSGSDARCSNSAVGYWLNSTEDGGDGHDMMWEATAKCTNGTAGVNTCTSWSYSEAFSIRYDGVNQAVWGAANDVGYCLRDLVQGTNTTGCNPNLYKRTNLKLVFHSEGGAIADRIFSTGWFPEVASATSSVATSAGALAGARSASALYGTDGASNFCTSFVSFLAGWALKDTGTASLTRGTIIGEARNGKAGKSPKWFNKITTTGGSGSCNNNNKDGISENANDGKMGALCGCIGYSTDDDTDGVLWMYDTDPTANPAGSNGGKYRAEYTGNYWRWGASWANHSHNRNDAYVRKYGYQGTNGCYWISPGTCIGQYL
jgi:hypothetical protein